MSNRRITVILLAFFILLAAAFMTYFYRITHDVPKHLAVLGEPGQKVQPFSFVNQDGKTITNADVDGKVYVVEYFFTTCKGICPKMNENMNLVYRAYKGNKDFMILSHSVDPVHDTVEAMKAYSQRFEADANQWMFLTGDKKKLYDMARYSYLISAQDDTTGLSVDQDFIHDNHFLLVDRTGHLRGKFYDGLRRSDVDSLIGDIKILLAEKQQ
jgi:protein SCO1/2